jgi:uncharacterized protein (DUF1330 family)
MAFEMTVGLFIDDREKYAQYRAGIAPLLDAAGGAFRYDFEVSRTLRSEGDREMNRVFVLRFPDRAAKERFFADPRYLEIRREFFDKAVRHRATIAEYDA